MPFYIYGRPAIKVFATVRLFPNERPFTADTVEKLLLNRLSSHDSVFPLIWEIVGDDGTKEGSASGTFLRVLA